MNKSLYASLLMSWAAALSLQAADPVKLELRLVAKAASESTREYTIVSPKGVSDKVFLEPKVLLDNSAVASAHPSFDQLGWSIALEFTTEGSKQFAEITKAHVNERIAILIDERVLSAPNIREPITGGRAIIAGNFTEKEATDLATALSASKPGKGK